MAVQRVAAVHPLERVADVTKGRMLAFGTLVALAGAGTVIAGVVTDDWLSFGFGLVLTFVGVGLQALSERCA